MSQISRAGQASVIQILDLMDQQREELFADLAGASVEQLWHQAGPGEWSIGENVDHLRAIYASMLPWFQLSWVLLQPFARLRRGHPYTVEIDNVYHRPGFPQKVGWMWPPRYTPSHPVALATLQEGLAEIQGRVRRFYGENDQDLLGHIVLWDPAIGLLNLIQALRVGVYHDEVHIDSIRKMKRDFERAN